MSDTFDDAALRSAMQDWLAAAASLERVHQTGGQAREVIALAEAKAVAGMSLRKRLVELGWTAPVPQRVQPPQAQEATGQRSTT